MTNKITKPHSFGIWGNTDKPRFWELLDPLLKWAEKKKMIPFITVSYTHLTLPTPPYV